MRIPLIWHAQKEECRVEALNELHAFNHGEVPKEIQFKARQQRNLCKHHNFFFFLGHRLEL